MSEHNIIKRVLPAFFLSLSILCLAFSAFLPSRVYDSSRVAKQVSEALMSRITLLDSYVAQLASHSVVQDEWEDLKDFPEDMVIYRYLADSLHSWYNILASMPSLDEYSDIPIYRDFGRKSYIVRRVITDDGSILAALAVKDNFGANMPQGQGGVNPVVNLHGKYDIAPMSSEEGSVVYVLQTPIFKIVPLNGIDQPNQVAAVGLRWAALLLFSLFLLAFLKSFHNVRGCGIVILLLFATGIVARIWAPGVADVSVMFSPTLYAHDGILNSFGILLIFNWLIFIAFLAVFMCRRQLAERFASPDRKGVAYITILCVVFASAIFYIFYTLVSIVRNSDITLELYRINVVNYYTFFAYISYVLLSVGILLLIETIVAAINRIKGTSFTMMRLMPMSIFSTVAAVCILTTVTNLGFTKEENRVALWGNRLAVDRNLGVEMSLRMAEEGIAADELLDALCHTDHAEPIVQRQLERHFRRITNQCSIAATIVPQIDDQMRSYMESLIRDGVLVGPGSRFIYNRDSSRGSYYVGVFTYYSQEKGMANLIVEVVPRSSDNVQIPPSYSYARYEQGRISSFSGNYAYPTILEGFVDMSSLRRSSFVENGYCHFVRVISDEEVIVISRREEGWMIYIITFSYLVFMLMLVALIFRNRHKTRAQRRNRFSRRIITMVVVSLVITLVSMATVSVLFVYNRNEQNLTDAMSNRISTVQITLDGVCRQYSGPEDVQTMEFRRALDNVSRNFSTPLDVYSPNGTLYVSTTRSNGRRMEMRSLISPEAYRSICLNHQRFYIERNAGPMQMDIVLYAPVMNAAGKIVAIVSMPYIQRDYDFMRDAVFHAAAVVSLFLILLLITLLATSSIVKAIFHPLVTMSAKMSGVDTNSLEQIEYKGDDEISSLVASYNKMVVDLKESTGKLAAAERDKAWSEMARQVAHEIKNPLTPIKLEIQRLQRLRLKNDPNWESKFDDMSAVILEHIDILTQTANEFSTFAKLYSEPSIEIDLDRTLKEQVMLFENRGVNITYLGVEGATVMGPKPQLIRVFVNLLTNAIQAVEGAENPHIMVSLRKGAHDGSWTVVFEDNGPGVSPENQSRLFTPNFTTKSSGTGLGLAICRSIIDRCGGSISYCRSFALGGACFTVDLPVSQETEE